MPSAIDNRPLSYEEFDRHINQAIYVSATPSEFERIRSSQIVEQLIRPTGLLDPLVEVRPTDGQIDDLIEEIRVRVERGERALVTTLTKKMSEDLADYLRELGVKAHYLHSEMDTFERVELLRDLRLGVYDCVVGINLLREGIDLPEVSLVAIIDADKEGFLRSEGSMVQTIGRAARHVDSKAILYADVMTDSMQGAIDETNRRRAAQIAHNEKYEIEPKSIRKAIRDITDQVRQVAEDDAEYAPLRAASGTALPDRPRHSKEQMARLMKDLEKQMKLASRELEFERAALLRDQLVELRRDLIDGADALPQWADQAYGRHRRPLRRKEPVGD